MDPTKPILGPSWYKLDIYGDTYSTQRSDPPKQPVQRSSHNYASGRQYSNTANYGNSRKNEPSYSELKEKYQELYRAYTEKTDKLANLEIENERLF